MFPGIGTVLNISTIIIGSMIGILIGAKLSEKLRNLIVDVLGCVTAISAADALSAYWDPTLTKALPDGGAILVIIFSLLLGALIGTWLKIEELAPRTSADAQTRARQVRRGARTSRMYDGMSERKRSCPAESQICSRTVRSARKMVWRASAGDGRGAKRGESVWQRRGSRGD